MKHSAEPNSVGTEMQTQAKADAMATQNRPDTAPIDTPDASHENRVV